MSLGIGSIVWVFDENYREYPPAEPGQRFPRGGPIYEKHWREAKIVGETRVSWILSAYYGKFPKQRPTLGAWTATAQGGFKHKVATTPEELAEDIWAHSHRHHVVDMVNKCNVTLLRQVAGLLGYKGENV